MSLRAGTATGQGRDVLRRIEDIDGSQHDDVLIGNAQDNGFSLAGGNDRVVAGRGADGAGGTSEEGRGNDRIDLGPGDDEARGGHGNDIIRGGPGTTSTLTGAFARTASMVVLGSITYTDVMGMAVATGTTHCMEVAARIQSMARRARISWKGGEATMGLAAETPPVLLARTRLEGAGE